MKLYQLPSQDSSLMALGHNGTEYFTVDCKKKNSELAFVFNFCESQKEITHQFLLPFAYYHNSWQNIISQSTQTRLDGNILHGKSPERIPNFIIKFNENGIDEYLGNNGLGESSSNGNQANSGYWYVQKFNEFSVDVRGTLWDGNIVLCTAGQKSCFHGIQNKFAHSKENRLCINHLIFKDKKFAPEKYRFSLEDKITDICFSPEGSHLLVITSDQFILYETNNWSHQTYQMVKNLKHCCWSQDGLTFGGVTTDNIVCTWDLDM